jgi:hypothetical protein
MRGGMPMDFIAEMGRDMRTAARKIAKETAAQIIEEASRAREGDPLEEIEGELTEAGDGELLTEEEKELSEFIFDNVIMEGSLEALQADLAEKVAENYHNPVIRRTWVDGVIFEADEGCFAAKYSRAEDGALIVEVLQPLKAFYLTEKKAGALNEILNEEASQRHRAAVLSGLKTPFSKAKPLKPGLLTEDMKRMQVLSGIRAPFDDTDGDGDGSGELLED